MVWPYYDKPKSPFWAIFWDFLRQWDFFYFKKKNYKFPKTNGKKRIRKEKLMDWKAYERTPHLPNFIRWESTSRSLNCQYCSWGKQPLVAESHTLMMQNKTNIINFFGFEGNTVNFIINQGEWSLKKSCKSKCSIT